MTEQDKITIFDALIKPFLRDDSQTSEHQEDNLFALAIRLLLNSSLRAQQDEHLGCERYERMPARIMDSNHIPFGRPPGKLLWMSHR